MQTIQEFEMKKKEMSFSNSARPSWENQYVEKYDILWSDPWRRGESSFLFYCFALPVSYLADFFIYTCRNKSIPKEHRPLRFSGFKPIDSQNNIVSWAPGTNLRILSQWKLVLSWTFVLMIIYLIIIGINSALSSI